VKTLHLLLVLSLAGCWLDDDDGTGVPLDDGAVISCSPASGTTSPGVAQAIRVEVSAARRENRVATLSASGGRVTQDGPAETTFWTWFAPLDEGQYTLTAAVAAKPEITAQCVFQLSRNPALDIDPSRPNLPYRLAWRPDSRELALLDENGRVLFFEAATNRFSSYVVAKQPNAAAGLAYEPDLTDLAVAGAGGQLALIDVRSGRWFPLLHDVGAPRDVAFDPEQTAWVCTDRCLARVSATAAACVVPQPCDHVSVGANGGVIYGEGVGTLSPLTNELLRADAAKGRLSRDGQLVARLPSPRRIEVVSAATGALVRVHTPPFDVSGLAISPRGERVVASTADLSAADTMCVFDASAEAPRRCFDTTPLASGAPRREVLDLAFSPDGARFAAIERDPSGRSLTNWTMAELDTE
jgi:DNA-binding beta-propeller fold protein YncE